MVSVVDHSLASSCARIRVRGRHFLSTPIFLYHALAVKCNNSPAVLGTLAALGTGFDCASKGIHNNNNKTKINTQLNQMLSTNINEFYPLPSRNPRGDEPRCKR